MCPMELMLDIAMSVRPSGLFHSRSSSIFPNIQVRRFSPAVAGGFFRSDVCLKTTAPAPRTAGRRVLCCCGVRHYFSACKLSHTTGTAQEGSIGQAGVGSIPDHLPK